ncbi:amidohydrolase family protein [Saccharopolyspora sp. NPDC002686]|uniref:amidohydrolase family protein n=1 Tax=Saccharopolyspora sp. NPDC002686 TaxID=3154541 RepID=UPI00332DDC42
MSAPRKSTLVVANATIANASGRRSGHVLVADGVIADVLDASAPVPDADRVIDASGRIVIPGGVDGHCHIAQVTGGWRTTDDYATTTLAALAGGTTTVMDFGIPAGPEESPLAAAEAKIAMIAEARCDVGLHASVIDWDDSVPAQLRSLAERGIRSVKLYTTNRGTTMATRDTILKVFEEMTRIDGLSYVHAEHDEIIVASTDRQAATGRIDIRQLGVTRPELAEEASVREVIALAEYTGAPVYFVHQSTPGAVDLVTEARGRGLPVYSETCPHYIALNSEVYDGPLPEFYACCPPMRDRKTMEALRSRLLAGDVDAMSSDHSAYDLGQKRARADDIRFMPHGLPGVETRLPVSFTHMVAEDLTGLENFVSVFAAEPARLNGLEGKGAVEAGRDADLVVIDPGHQAAVDGSALHMGTDFSPFEGMALRGWPQTVIAAGRVVVDSDGVHDPGPVGRFLQQRPFSTIPGRDPVEVAG